MQLRNIAGNLDPKSHPFTSFSRHSHLPEAQFLQRCEPLEGGGDGCAAIGAKAILAAETG